MDIARTLIHLLEEKATRLADRPALWSKREGVYLPTSWRQYATRVKRFALGLLQRPVAAGTVVAVAAGRREEWAVATLGAMAIGAVPVALDPADPVEKLVELMAQIGVQLLVADDDALVDAVLAKRKRLPQLADVISLEEGPPRADGIRRYRDVLASGAGQEEATYYQTLHRLEPHALAALACTRRSSRVVMLSHRNLCWTALQLGRCYQLEERDGLLSFLPLSHVVGQMASVYLALALGAQVYFGDALESVVHNLLEARPRALVGPPEVWSFLKDRWDDELEKWPDSQLDVLQWARRGASIRLTRKLGAERVPALLEAQYRAAQQLVFSDLKRRLGLERTSLSMSEGAPLPRSMLDFFVSLDLIVRELYGHTEATGVIAVNAVGATRLGTAGRPLPGVELRVDRRGEGRLRGENVCLGYWKDEAASQKLTEGGWLLTGDVLDLDPDGFVSVKSRI